jgi:hypothetical protein
MDMELLRKVGIILLVSAPLAGVGITYLLANTQSTVEEPATGFMVVFLLWPFCILLFILGALLTIMTSVWIGDRKKKQNKPV